MKIFISLFLSTLLSTTLYSQDLTPNEINFIKTLDIETQKHIVFFDSEIQQQIVTVLKKQRSLDVDENVTDLTKIIMVVIDNNKTNIPLADFRIILRTFSNEVLVTDSNGIVEFYLNPEDLNTSKNSSDTIDIVYTGKIGSSIYVSSKVLKLKPLVVQVIDVSKTGYLFQD